MYNPRLIPVALAFSIGTSSCVFRKPPAARVFVPPTPFYRTVPVKEIPTLPAPPEIEMQAEATAELPSDISSALPTLPPPPVKRPAPVPPKPAPTVAGPEPVPTAQPRIGQIFTADQYREYNKTLDESLDRVKKALDKLAGRNLNPSQTEIAERIRTFQKQAEQAREQDLVTAVNLARRADLLARDLLERLP